MLWYFKLLARRPYLVLLLVAVVSISCIIVSLALKKLPDFTDPTLGFEARGTPIGQRMTAWHNLLEETRPSGQLIANPAHLWQSYKPAPPNPHPKPKKHKKKNKNKFNAKKKTMRNNRTISSDPYDIFENDESHSNSTYASVLTVGDDLNRTNTWHYGQNRSSTDEEAFNHQQILNRKQWNLILEAQPPSAKMEIRESGFFCENPNPDYAHFVVKRVHHNLTVSLFEINGLLAMCDLEFQITQTSGYDEMCENEVGYTRCCRPWSLPNYVALLANRSSCFDLKPEDVGHAGSLLLRCAEHYRTLKLSSDCATNRCRVPAECAQHNAVYNMLHYLSDTQAVVENATTVDIKVAMIFIPIAKSTKALPLYYALEHKPLANQLVAVVAIDMGLKTALFDDCLLLDCWLLAFGGVFIMVCMCLYTKSLLLTIMTFIAIGFSLGIAYFVYSLVFELPFFPFMNLLAVIVIVGIGADDAFIYVKVWNCAIAERELAKDSASGGSKSATRDTLAGLVAVTMTHAAISMMVTSLTTAVAFYSSFLNSITAVKCFGIFAGTAVLCNYVLMVTWLPASVTLIERLTCLTPPLCYERPLQLFFSFVNRIGSAIENLIVWAVVEWPLIWILLFSVFGLLSAVIVFYWPSLQLPDSPDFKLFDADHPFEMYDSHYRNMFWFEKTYRDTETLPLRFVWGVEPIDTGNVMDPSARGNLHLDHSLNVSSQVAQQWLLDFCKDIKRQPFYQFTSGAPMQPNCFIENVIRTMDRRCVDPMSLEDRSPCCDTASFPYEPHVFDRCLPDVIAILYDSPRYVFLPGVGGPKFGRDTVGNGTADEDPPVVRALVVEFESNQPYSMSYTDLAEFRNTVEIWFALAMRSAPEGMQRAWFISELSFFDLQATLSTDTLYAIAVAMVVSLVVLMLVTLNLLISLLAIVTVTLTIFSTIAILVLMDWKLNVLESISVSTAIGLTIDFSLHYGNNYRWCPESSREAATKYSLTRMIGPTAMAALTTGAAGAFMLPSRVLPYIQIGKFLVIVMTVSWLYATFFFMSTLRVIGPTNGFGQLNWPLTRKKKTSDGGANGAADMEHRSSQCTATDQLLSPTNSGAGDAIVTLESHELQALIGSGLVKPLTELEARPISFDRAFRREKDVRLSIALPGDNDSSPTSTNGVVDFLPDDILDTLESQDLTDITGSGLIKPLNELEAQPLSFDRAIRRNDTNTHTIPDDDMEIVKIPIK